MFESALILVDIMICSIPIFFVNLHFFATWPHDLAYKPSSSAEQQSTDEGGAGGIDF